MGRLSVFKLLCAFLAANIFALCDPVVISSALGDGIDSYDIRHTVMKVRTAVLGGRTVIIGSSYEGAVLAITESGKPLWKNDLSGVMNHDVWCEDLDGDGNDEILTANADGHVYCLNSFGKLIWKFKVNDAPMYAVCAMKHRGRSAVVCGSYDNKVYYLSASGKQTKILPSSLYSEANPWGKDPDLPRPPPRLHVANFLRTLVAANEKETLAVHGSLNMMQDRGIVYLFDPAADQPIASFKVDAGSVIGDEKSSADGNALLMGTSGSFHGAEFMRMDVRSGQLDRLKLSDLGNQLDGFGYRVVQPIELSNNNEFRYLLFFGRQLILVPQSMDAERCKVISGNFSFNDVWNDRENQRVILASSQSGGSCIHVLNLRNPNWEEDFQRLIPPGNITAILKASELVREKVATFKRPMWEREPLPVYLMSEQITESVKPLVNEIVSNHQSPVFLDWKSLPAAENYDRSGVRNQYYRDRRDGRLKYTLTQQEAIDELSSIYKGKSGAAYWGGHGNDPMMFQLDTLKSVIQRAGGKTTVLIYPEMEDVSEAFQSVMDDFLYPLAEFARNHRTKIYLRNKHAFWQANVYLKAWDRLRSGEFADVFIPAMEETTDKAMDLSIAGRSGIWASGVADAWGSRCARDNTTFDRSREHSHQMLPNHFLRMMVYHIASGSQYIDNFAVDQDYMSLLWEMIAKGALYVPKRNEIVSYSPVHLSMVAADEEYILESANVKWSTFFDAEKEALRPMVFSRMNGTWPGAPVTPWDFSRYASGVKDRRLNFLPPYRYGLVLITPPQAGFAADRTPQRGRLRDHLHPMYRDLLREHYTDGRHYYTADGKPLPADEYYQVIEKDIQSASAKLPLTVSGDVAWVAAQTSPKHLRLTLIDSGYINPKSRRASVQFHTVRPVKMTDVLFGNKFDLSNPADVEVSIPCGMFRFLDIELSDPLAY